LLRTGWGVELVVDSQKPTVLVTDMCDVSRALVGKKDLAEIVVSVDGHQILGYLHSGGAWRCEEVGVSGAVVSYAMYELVTEAVFWEGPDEI
jgi:hypothetical protein